MPQMSYFPGIFLKKFFGVHITSNMSEPLHNNFWITLYIQDVQTDPICLYKLGTRH